MDWEYQDGRMDAEANRRMEYLEKQAEKDPVYRDLFRRYRELETVFRDIEGKILSEYRDIIWDYFGCCDDMTRRLTELACIYMRIPEER